jgi:ABC-type glycerol-3-phosphate transport system permease component
MKMDRNEAARYGIPLVLAIVLVTAVIVLGLASQNPDGFEWSLFDFAGITEPTGGFEGIWAFLGNSTIVDVMTGIIGIIAILFLGYAFFWVTSRKTK